jgi:biopolymer transport protein ExbD
MSNRNSSENSDSISLFPFLAVLLCTMGALLVLLVIFMQRAAEISLLPDAPDHQLASATGPVLSAPKVEKVSASVIDDEQTAELEQAIAEVAEYQQKLDEIKAEGQERLKDEQQRLSHLEDHRRRLEEELAKLAIAAEQLKQTEANQTVDQEQAEEELARLQELVTEKQAELAELKNAEAGGKKSYAIIPYKGPNGTFRMPVYLECKGDAITIHPEGHKLTKNDFVASSWPGNPLAAVLRATREFHNDKARKAGQPEPPDPYPLILVRPSGLTAYMWARSAISAWDSDYGYEFIDEEMKLAFPFAADPQLAQVQNHSLMIARERLLHMVQAAPSRFPGLKMSGGSAHLGSDGPGTGYGSGGGDGVYGGSSGGSSDGEAYGDASGSNGSGDGTGGPADEQMIGTAGGQEGPRFGEYHGDPNAQAGTSNGATASSTAQNGGVEGENTQGDMTQGAANSAAGPDLGPRYAQQGSGYGNGGGNGSLNNAPSEPLDGKNSAGNGQMASGSNGSAGGPGGSTGGGAGGTPGTGFSSSGQSSESIANTRGSNWAVNQPKQKSVAIRRTIHVAVRDNQMILQPSAEARRGAAGKQISLDQSVDKISDEFSAAVKERIDDWGLAGSGMYWRPVLELNVEPGAQMTATRIGHLLHDSGVEVQLPATANHPGTNSGGAVR